MMIKKFYLFTLLSLFIASSVAIISNFGIASAASSISNGLNNAACDADQSNPYCVGQKQNNTEDPIVKTIRKVTDTVAMVGGIVAVIFVIMSGYRYVTSSGDPQKTTAARSTLIYALVGLVVIIVAQSIVLLVLNRLK